MGRTNNPRGINQYTKSGGGRTSRAAAVKKRFLKNRRRTHMSSQAFNKGALARTKKRMAANTSATSKASPGAKKRAAGAARAAAILKKRHKAGKSPAARRLANTASNVKKANRMNRRSKTRLGRLINKVKGRWNKATRGIRKRYKTYRRKIGNAIIRKRMKYSVGKGRLKKKLKSGYRNAKANKTYYKNTAKKRVVRAIKEAPGKVRRKARNAKSFVKSASRMYKAHKATKRLKKRQNIGRTHGYRSPAYKSLGKRKR